MQQYAKGCKRLKVCKSRHKYTNVPVKDWEITKKMLRMYLQFTLKVPVK